MYGKKVEYLHGLVYKALEHVKNGGRAVQGGEGCGKKKKKKEEEENEEPHCIESAPLEVDAFLNIDDVIDDEGGEHGVGVDVVEDGGDDGGFDRVPLSRGAENRLEQGICMYADGDLRNFKMVSCYVHESGALILDTKDQHLLSEFSYCHPVDDSLDDGGGRREFDSVLPDLDDIHDEHPVSLIGGGGEEVEEEEESTSYGENRDNISKISRMGCFSGGSGHHALMNAHSSVLNESHVSTSSEVEFDPFTPLDPTKECSWVKKPFRKISRRRNQTCSMRIYPYSMNSKVEAQKKGKKMRLLPEFEILVSKLKKASSIREPNAEKGLFSEEDVEKQKRDEYAVANEPNWADNDYIGEENDFVVEENSYIGEESGENISGDELKALEQEKEISYEDLCRAHAESALVASAAFEVKTDLSIRVTDWKRKILPVLEREETRPVFDMQVYCKGIISSLSKMKSNLTLQGNKENIDENKTKMQAAKSTECVKFDQLVQNIKLRGAWDIPRIFSSMLQLVNEGKVQILETTAFEEGFGIKLTK